MYTEGRSATLLQRNPPRQLPSPRALTSVVLVLGQEAAGGGYRGHGSGATRTPPLSGRSLRGERRVSPWGAAFTVGSRARRSRAARGPRHRRSGSPLPAAPRSRPGGSPVSPSKSRRPGEDTGPRFSPAANTSSPPGRPYMGRGGGRPAPGAVWWDGTEPAPARGGAPAPRPGHLGTSSRLSSLSTFLECIKWGLRASELTNDSHPCGEGVKGDETDRCLFQ